MGRLSLSAAARLGGAGAAVILFAVAASGGELVGGEGDAAEHLAGVLGAAGGVAAFLCGDAVVHHRYNELGVPLQSDDGELPQRHKQPPAVILQSQILVKHGPDPIRYLHLGAVPHAAVAGLPHPGAEHHGIKHLFYGHQIGREPGAAGDRTNF